MTKNSTAGSECQCFCKSERLYSKKLINELFEKGHSYSVFPVRMIWHTSDFDSPFPVQVFISVPKRHFKKAVHRNRLKRLIREAFRKNKQEIYNYLLARNIKMAVGFVYSGSEMSNYSEIESKIVLLLHKITEIHAKGH